MNTLSSFTYCNFTDESLLFQIGCPNEPEDFVVSGTCSEQLYGMCEALWEPNLSPDELFETISQVKNQNFGFSECWPTQRPITSHCSDHVVKH